MLSIARTNDAVDDGDAGDDKNDDWTHHHKYDNRTVLYMHGTKTRIGSGTVVTRRFVDASVMIWQHNRNKCLAQARTGVDNDAADDDPAAAASASVVMVRWITPGTQDEDDVMDFIAEAGIESARMTPIVHNVGITQPTIAPNRNHLS